MNSLNELPIEVCVIKDSTISILHIQNNKTKNFELRQNVSLKEDDVIVIKQGALKDYPSLFKATNKGLSIASFDYQELTSDFNRKTQDIHNDYKIKLDAKDSIIASLNNDNALLKVEIQKLKEGNIILQSSSDNIDDDQSSNNPEVDNQGNSNSIPLPERPSKKNSK